MTFYTDWNTDRVSRMLVLHAEKKSASVIATTINTETGSSFSRNSVIGKLHRSGLRGNKPVSCIKRRPKRTHRFHISNSGNWRNGPSLPSSPVPPSIVFTTEHKCGFFALGNTSCRWPLWEGDEPLNERFYCGTPEANFDDGKPWCLAHANVAAHGFSGHANLKRHIGEAAE